MVNKDFIMTESYTFLQIFLIFYFMYLFLERGREGEREGEKYHCVVASPTPSTGDLAATQACALTGNQTSDPLVCSQVLSPPRHTSQSRELTFCKTFLSVFLILRQFNAGQKLSSLSFDKRPHVPFPFCSKIVMW